MQSAVYQSAAYEFVSQAVSPVSKKDMKSYLKVKHTIDDVLIQSMIDAATKWGENYTGRDFRAITWKLLLDCFPANERILVKRDPVDTIASINRLVSDVDSLVPSSDYYLKKNTQNSEILLFEDKSWPDDTDNREQAITIDFVTKGYHEQDNIISAIKMHVAYWYYNRGDCDSDSSAEQSGVKTIYSQFRITRVC